MFAQPTISCWGCCAERGLWRVHYAALNRLKWFTMERGGEVAPKPRPRGRCVELQTSELLQKSRLWRPPCLCGGVVFGSYLFNRMNVKATGKGDKKKKKRQHKTATWALLPAHVALTSCWWLFLGLLCFQRFPLFYFWQQNMDLDLRYSS